MPSAATAERFHIVLAPEEKRRWTTNAAAAGLPTSEYVRRAVEAYGDENRLTLEEREMVDLFLTEVKRFADEVRSTVEDIGTILSQPFDEDALRAEYADYFARNPPQFDPDILDFSRLQHVEAA